MCLTEHLLVHFILNRLIGTERAESMKLQCEWHSRQQEISARNSWASWFSFQFLLLDSFAGQPAHRPCLCCRHAGIEHTGPEGCFWALSAICNMGRLHRFPSSANQIKILLQANTTLSVRKLCFIASPQISIFSLEPFVQLQCHPLISIKLVPKCC